MDKFPQDILNLILEFDGRIKYRKGEYVNCISKNDYRYNILKQLKFIKIPLGDFKSFI